MTREKGGGCEISRRDGLDAQRAYKNSGDRMRPSPCAKPSKTLKEEEKELIRKEDRSINRKGRE